MINKNLSVGASAQKSTKAWLFSLQAFILATLMLSAVFSSCETPKSETVEKGDGYNVIVIDSCEYIEVKDGVGTYGGYYSISHKGNCKFCAARKNSR